MKPLLVLSLTFASAAAALAQTAEPPTALDALKLLPKGEAKKLARIEAREGTPDPGRWYLLTHDETAENGLREYVVAAGEVVASRHLSQFVESVQPADVIGGDAVKYDSDKAGRLAQQYALANKVTVSALHYELRKDGPDAAPLWTVTCVDEAGAELGRLVISAGKGTVISHDGFPIEPPPTAPRPKPKAKTQATATVEAAHDPEVRRAETVAPPEPKPGLFQRVGGSLQRVFTGKSPQDR